MADHWKSIANKLGAPGVDEPEPETQEAETTLEGSELPESKPDEAAVDEASPVSEEARSDEADSFASGRDAFSPLPASPKSFSESKPKALPETRVTESKREQPAPQPKREEPAPEPVKPKRKSSWESLASMFNVKIDRSKPAEVEEPAAEAVDQVAADESDEESPLSIFSGDKGDTNPALDAMFGDAPRESVDQRGSHPRVVDDLGWADEEPPPVTRSEEATSDEGDEAPRRGRRRRGRGRGRGRGRDEVADQNAAEGPDADADAGVRWSAGEPSESVDDWQEPESFTDSGDRDDFESSSPDELSERRSSRRRRRGRGRDRARDEEGAAPAPELKRMEINAEPLAQDDSDADDDDGPASEPR